MLIGYARVSTADQNLNLQLDALVATGCERIFEDHISGTKSRRPGLDQALASLQAGDVLTVWRLDRLGRSLAHLIALIGELERKQIGFRSLSETIDTTTAGGRLVMHMFGALSEFERALIIERTKAGQRAAKARGVSCGRRPGLTPDQTRHAKQALANGESPRKVAALFNVGKSTLYRHIGRPAT
jgi:DNA invertase Pin-like site-specific DNA recombinase